MKSRTLSCKLKLLHARGVCLEVMTKRRSEYCAPPQRSRSCSRPRPRPISLARPLSPRSLFLFRSPPGARWLQWTGFQLFVLTSLLCKLLLMLDRRAFEGTSGRTATVSTMPLRTASTRSSLRTPLWIRQTFLQTGLTLHSQWCGR